MTKQTRRSCGRALAACLLILAFATVRASAQPREPLRYTLRFPAPHTHYIEVEASVPTGGQAEVELMMAVWTPGSYLVREYSRNVEAVTAAAGGRALDVRKTLKNRWRIATGGAPRVTVAYRVYGHEMTVRSDWVEAGFAMINGAPTFMTLADQTPRPHEVQLVLPQAWKTSITGMPDGAGGAHHYVAPDFDTLVDSPIVAGNPAIYRFDVNGKTHDFVNVGEGGVWNGPQSAADVERIVRAQSAMWGSLPYDKYVFFNLLTEAAGALEHRNSVMMMASRWAMSTRSRYVGWLSTTSHEFFHLWNVKRLRPVELGPFDYEHEVYTRSLWIAEGLTDYYADVMLCRAGLITAEEYLALLSAAIGALQTTPGRLVQPVETASFDAWIKQYRPDENSGNSSISYYTKGAVIGFALDARIRQATGGAKTLDDVMRAAFQRFSGPRGFTPDEFRRTASDVAGTDLSQWFAAALESTKEIAYKETLDWFGLAFAPPAPPPIDPPGWLGAEVRSDAGRLVVARVPRGTPALDAGLNVDDEILAIGEFRVRADNLDDRLDAYKPGERVSLLIARRDELTRLDVTLGSAPRESWMLEIAPAASAVQRQHFEAWLARR